MSQSVQELINKIKTEGIGEAEKKAQAIEAEARDKARGIVKDAETRAAAIIREADEKAKQTDAATRAALAQAGANLLRSLRQEIEALSRKILLRETQTALTPEMMKGLIEKAVTGAVAGGAEAQVAFSPSDVKTLQEGLVSRLQGELRKPVVFRSRGDVARGFMVSFDGGKSSFDFTDEALAQYLSGFVSEEVAALLKG
ncbi:MAG: hypothetical protein GX606_02660 [Elusimicrobia bacterium]|nr:hypothetical protein [Elusimicrobiota bacterium]